MDISTLKKTITSDLPNGQVYFSPQELPPSVTVPSEWLNFGIAGPSKTWIPAEWSGFSEKLPWVLKWLKSCVIGTVIIVTDRVYLGYVFLDKGTPSLYLGGLPLKDSPPNKYVSLMPSDLQTFYRDLHDGFVFYPSFSMGPERSDDLAFISELCDEEEPELLRLLSIFSNGGGDSIALDLDSHLFDTYIWWHEEPTTPERTEDMWPLMDTWISIFLENTDLNTNFN